MTLAKAPGQDVGPAMLTAGRLCLAAAVLSAAMTTTGSCDGVRKAGDVLKIAIPASALATTIFISDREGGYQLSKGFLTTLAITYALKCAVDRERPNGGSKSFPSGHAAAAFSGASFIDRRYGHGYGGPAYLAASFVGWSRVHAEEHYVGDVLAGAAIGILTTYVFATPHESRLAVVPALRDGVYYACLCVCWW